MRKKSIRASKETKKQEKSLESWIRDAACGSSGLLVKPGTVMEEKERGFSSPRKEREGGWKTPSPLKLFGQEYIPETWAMANMNMTIHDMGGQIETGDTFKNPMLRDKGGKLRTFDRVVTNPMRNQDWFTEADELERFPAGVGFPGKEATCKESLQVQNKTKSIVTHPSGPYVTSRAAVVLDTPVPPPKDRAMLAPTRKKQSASGSGTKMNMAKGSVLLETLQLPPKESSSRLTFSRNNK